MFNAVLVVAVVLGAEPSHAPAYAERSETAQRNSLLKTWEVQSNRGKVIQIEFNRFIYDTAFRHEMRSEGRLIFGDAKYRVDLYASQYEEGEKSRRDGYILRPVRAETWVSTSIRTLQIDHANQHIFHHSQHDQNAAVAQTRTDNGGFPSVRFPTFWDDLVPTFLRVRSEDLRRRFFITLDHDEDFLVLKMIPRGEPESLFWKSLEVMWSRDLQRVHALRIVDSGSMTVYVVKSYQIDPHFDRDALYDPKYPDYHVRE